MECPRCFKLLEAPIYQCSAGHSYCSNCKGAQCVKCNISINVQRNYGLESMINVVKLPCRNKKHGCNEYIFHQETKQHELCCYYNLYKCGLCSWQGVDVDVKNHLLASHVRYLRNVEQYQYIEDFKSHDINYFKTFDEIFVFNKVVKLGFLYLNMTCLGKQDRKKKFYYEIKVEFPNDSQKYLTISEVCSDVNLTMDKKIEYDLLRLSNEDEPILKNEDPVKSIGVDVLAKQLQENNELMVQVMAFSQQSVIKDQGSTSDKKLATAVTKMEVNQPGSSGNRTLSQNESNNTDPNQIQVSTVYLQALLTENERLWDMLSKM